MATYINRKQAMQHFGVDVRKHKWTSEQVQERKKGTGMEKWYDVEAVRAVAMAKPAEVAAEPAEVVDVIPALTAEEIGAFKPEVADAPEVFDAAEVAEEPGDYVEVKIAKRIS